MKLFFDVDGVLIDGWHARPERRRPWDVDLEQDLGIAREALQAALFARQDPARPAPIELCARGEADLAAVLAELLPAIGFHQPVSRFLDYWFTKDSAINEEVMAVVERLAEVPAVELHVATAQEHRRADYLWRVLGFRRRFRSIFYTARVGFLKDDPRFYSAVDREVGRVPEERPLFFDDSEAVVAAARRAGWDACLFEAVEDITGHPRLRGLLAASPSA